MSKIFNNAAFISNEAKIAKINPSVCSTNQLFPLNLVENNVSSVNHLLKESLTKHFSLLFDSADKDEEQYICIRFLKDNKKGRNEFYKIKEISSEEIINKITELVCKENSQGYNTCILPCTTSERDAKKTYIKGSQVLIIDIDDGNTEEKLKELTALLGEPTAIIKSGGITHGGFNKLHVYYKFNEFLKGDNFDELMELRKNIAKVIGADTHFKLSTQVIRLIGTINHGYDNKPICKIEKYSPDITYDFKEFYNNAIKYFEANPINISNYNKIFESANSLCTDKEKIYSLSEVKKILDEYDVSKIIEINGKLDYATWYQCIFALSYNFNKSEDGYKLALDWSLKDTTRDEEEIKQAVHKYYYENARDDFLNPITFKTIEFRAKELQGQYEIVEQIKNHGKIIESRDVNNNEKYVLTENKLLYLIEKRKLIIHVLCNFIKLTGYGTGSEGSLFIEIETKNFKGELVKSIIQQSLKSDELLTRLQDKELCVDTINFSYLRRYISTYKGEKEVGILNKSGWDAVNWKSYEESDGKIGVWDGKGNFSLLYTDRVDSYSLDKKEDARKNYLEFKQINVKDYLELRGTLKQWQDNICKYAVGNDLIAFALIVPFSTLFYTPLKTRSAIYHFFGESSKGKSVLLDIAVSVSGFAVDQGNPSGYIKWSATENGLEGLCSAKNDMLLCLDELTVKSDPKLIYNAAYTIVNGQGKVRASAKGTGHGNRLTKTWKVVAISTGEVTLKTKLEESGEEIMGGQEVRFLDIPAVEDKYGIFNDLHGFKESFDLVKHFETETANYKGQAIREFLKFTTCDNKFSDILKEFKRLKNLWLEQYFDTIKDINKNQIKAIADNFAFSAAAGELAVRAGIFKDYLKEGDSFKIVNRIFKRYLDNLGDYTATSEERKILRKLKIFLQQKIDGAFFVEDGPDRFPINNNGWFGLKRKNKEDEYYILKDRLQDICGFNSDKVMSVLKQKKCVKPNFKVNKEGTNFVHKHKFTPYAKKTTNFYLLDLDAIGVTNSDNDDDPSGGGTDEPEDTIKDVDVSNNTDLVKSNILVLKPEISSVKEVKQATTATITKSTLFLDTECYPNYFLIMFKDNEGNTHSFELTPRGKLGEHDIIKIRNLIKNNLTVGFNSKLYDMPMIEAALRGYSNDNLKHISDKIINKGAFKTLNEYRLWSPFEYDHIDVMNVAKGKVSLKMYGARINTPFLQDLPYDPSMGLSIEQMRVVKEYCANDIDITVGLFNRLEDEIDIRTDINAEYGVDVRSKSDAQIAEALIKTSVKYDLENKVKEYDFFYNPPSYINFTTRKLKLLLDDIKQINFKGKDDDKLIKNNVLSSITINDTTYSLGIGGIHSTESNRNIIAKDDEYLIDVDVVSYYPSIILNNKYAPECFEQSRFLEFYERIYKQRIEAKEKGNKTKANVFKIILNGSFGKFGNKYSLLYSPKLLIHTTLTGQLSLLMLIEALEEQGFNVVSSNTDGITIHFKKAAYDKFKSVINNWEQETKFKTEETRYKALYNQSVNSYIAVKDDNSLKCKGIFADNDLAHNPTIKVCREAVIKYLVESKPIKETILNYDTDPKNFLMAQKVTTGGYWDDKYLGKVVRWYWSTKGKPIYRKLEKIEYKKNGSPKNDPKVASSDNAYPIMDLNVGLTDIHYDKYIQYTYELLETLGVVIT